MWRWRQKDQSYNKRMQQISAKSWHDLVRKVIHKELCKKFKFDPPNKWYMNKQESILVNETHKHLWDFLI